MGKKLNLDDREFADLVTCLRDVACAYASTQQLREQIATVLRPLRTTPPTHGCPFCNFEGHVNCGTVADRIRAAGVEPGCCSNARVYGQRTVPIQLSRGDA